MGRYTLINNQNEIIFRGRLSDIDRLTTDNIRELERNLENQGIKINGLRIHYRANYQDNYLSVLDEKYSYLNVIRRNGDTLDETDGKFRDIVLDLVNKVKYNQKLLQAILQSRCVNDRVKQYLELTVTENNIFDFNMLIHHLSQYKQLRELVLFIDQFEEAQKKVVEEPIQADSSYEEDIDPDEKMFDEWEKDR